MLKQDQFESKSSDLKLNRDCYWSVCESTKSCCEFDLQNNSRLSDTSIACYPTLFADELRVNQNFATNSFVSKKRTFAEAFAQRKYNVTFRNRKTTKKPVQHKTSLAITSANINENNDKITDTSERFLGVFDENQPLRLSLPVDKHQDCTTPLNLDCPKFSSSSKPNNSVCKNLSALGVQPKKVEPFSVNLGLNNDLEKLSKKDSDTNNKRRYCNNLPQLNKGLSEIDSEVLKRLFCLEEELREEILSSPPPRIPRLYRRSQSEFCQARKVAEAQLVSTRKSIIPSFKRYHSWTNGSKGNFHPINEVNPTAVPSAPAALDFTNTGSLSLEFNCNANATPHKKFSSKPELNFFGKQASNSIILPSRSKKTFPRLNASIKNSSKDLVEAEAVGQVDSSTKSLDQLSTGFQRISKASLREIPLEWFPGDKDIEDLARLKVDITKTLACTCKGKPGIRSRTQPFKSALITGEGTDKKLAQKLSDCSQCVCRNSSVNRNKFCDKESDCFQSNSKNTINDQRASKEAGNKLTIEKPPSFPATKKEIPHYLASLFSENRNNFEKKFRNYVELTAVEVVKAKPASETFAEFISRSKKKQLLQSSFNNHNVRKEAVFRIDGNHNKKFDCERGLKLVLEPTPSPQNNGKTNFNHPLFSSSHTFSTKNNSSSFCYVQKLSDMGCIHSVSQKKRVEPCRSSIFSDVRATIDQSPTIIEEYSPIVLRYRTPYFRAHAQVIMPPIRNKETWTVGWIQACDYMRFINQYGDLGYSSWEIPALKANRVPAVSDSDGVSYPWYGNTTEIATIVGPTDSYTRMNLTMNDNFYPSVTWDIPVSEGTKAHLTEIVRDQSFITWLAAINETTKEIIVLKTVRWSFYLEIHIDPTRELGQRARVVTPPIQNQPCVSNGPCEKHHVAAATKIRRRVTNNSNSNCLNHIPISALVRPSANNAQTLIWRPSRSEPIVVVPAKEEHLETNELVLFNGCSAMHGKEAIMKEISRQELIQLQQLTR